MAELAALFGAAYARLVQADREKARNDAVSHPENGGVSVENSLDSPPEIHPPWVGHGRHEGGR